MNRWAFVATSRLDPRDRTRSRGNSLDDQGQARGGRFDWERRPRIASTCRHRRAASRMEDRECVTPAPLPDGDRPVPRSAHHSPRRNTPSYYRIGAGRPTRSLPSPPRGSSGFLVSAEEGGPRGGRSPTRRSLPRTAAIAADGTRVPAATARDSTRRGGSTYGDQDGRRAPQHFTT